MPERLPSRPPAVITWVTVSVPSTSLAYLPKNIEQAELMHSTPVGHIILCMEMYGECIGTHARALHVHRIYTQYIKQCGMYWMINSNVPCEQHTAGLVCVWEHAGGGRRRGISQSGVPLHAGSWTSPGDDHPGAGVSVYMSRRDATEQYGTCRMRGGAAAGLLRPARHSPSPSFAVVHVRGHQRSVPKGRRV